MKRYAVGAVVGALALYAFQPDRTVTYPEVIVPAARILEREVVGPPTIVEKVRYVYLQPEVRAVAPAGVAGDVRAFCRPVVVSDTVRVESPWVIRSVAETPSMVPLRKSKLLVTSMNGYGDVRAEDYRVRPGFSATWGDDVSVRYPRGALFRELGEGLLWYGGFRVLEAVVRMR